METSSSNTTVNNIHTKQSKQLANRININKSVHPTRVGQPVVVTAVDNILTQTVHHHTLPTVLNIDIVTNYITPKNTV